MELKNGVFVNFQRSMFLDSSDVDGLTEDEIKETAVKFWNEDMDIGDITMGTDNITKIQPFDKASEKSIYSGKVWISSELYDDGSMPDFGLFQTRVDALQDMKESVEMAGGSEADIHHSKYRARARFDDREFEVSSRSVLANTKE